MTPLSLFVGFLIKDHLQLILITALFFVVIVDKPFEKRARIRLYIILGIIFFCLVFDYFDIAVGMMNRELTQKEISFRSHSILLQCALRPLILLLCVSFVYHPKKKWITPVMLIPAVVNIVLQILSIPNGWSLSISSQNQVEYHRMYNVYLDFCIFYLLFLIFIPIFKWKSLSRQERYVFVFIVLSVVTCFVVDSLGILADFHSMPTCIITSFLLYYIFLYTKKSKELIREKDMEAELNRNALLLSQIQPHFVLNTLNDINYLCVVDPETAQKTIVTFSDYLRSNLEIGRDGKNISVENEIAHTKLYTDIEKIRFPELTIVYEVHDGSYQVPPLIVQSMVENAIRHGVRGLSNAKVEITLTLEHGEKNQPIHKIVIHDNGNGKSRSNKAISPHTGIGIPNVRERVKKAGGTFDIAMSEQNGTTVTIAFPQSIFERVTEKSV